MSKKRKKVQAEKLNFTPVYVLGILASVAVIVMVVVLSVMNAPKQGEFIPPPFEDAAMQGIPDVPEELQYSSPYRDGMAYRFFTVWVTWCLRLRAITECGITDI